MLTPTARLARSRSLELLASETAAAPVLGRAHQLETDTDPTDQGKAGTKSHLLTDRNGLPLAFLLTGANCMTCVPLAQLFHASAPVKNRRGRPPQGLSKLHADKAYDAKRCRRACRRRSIKPRIVGQSVESNERLGRHCWVVERTLAWLARMRRLTICYERRLYMHHALTYLACSIICFHALQGRF